MKAPVVIAPYDPAWPAQFEAERQALLQAIGRFEPLIEHVGSTAVPGLAAKPILDLLVGLRSLDLAPACVAPLGEMGYEYVPEYEAQIPERRYFHKGPPGARTHHLHMVEAGGGFWSRHLGFRDYLRAHPETAREYEQLKRELAVRFADDRGAYTGAKTDFVRRVEALAR